ncbi:hypothetical protein ACFQU2_24735 [Siccirubricoccus deserti]
MIGGGDQPSSATSASGSMPRAAKPLPAPVPASPTSRMTPPPRIWWMRPKAAAETSCTLASCAAMVADTCRAGTDAAQRGETN